MATKQIKSKAEMVPQFNALEPSLKAKLFSALKKSTSVEQMELIEWLASEKPTSRSEIVVVPSLLKRFTPRQRMKLFEWISAPLSQDEDTNARLRSKGYVKELNIQKWLEKKTRQAYNNFFNIR